MIRGISVHIDNADGLDRLFSLASRVSAGLVSDALPGTARALYAAATYIEGAWKGWAQGRTLPGVRDITRPSQSVAASVTKTPDRPRFGDYEVYSEHPLMIDYQNGKDETIDMKAPGSPWLTGRHSRLNKRDGQPYLVVPFSWGTPGRTGGSAHFRNVVPGGIMRALERRSLSRSLGKLHTEKNYSGEDVPRDDYVWGGRITEDDAARYKVSDRTSAANGADADEVRSRAVGMVRMWDSAYGGSGNHGTYLTFRIISAKSAADRWIQRRHIEARDVTGALKREFEKMTQQTVRDAFMSDLGL